MTASPWCGCQATLVWQPALPFSRELLWFCPERLLYMNVWDRDRDCRTGSVLQNRRKMDFTPLFQRLQTRALGKRVRRAARLFRAATFEACTAASMVFDWVVVSLGGANKSKTEHGRENPSAEEKRGNLMGMLWCSGRWDYSNGRCLHTDKMCLVWLFLRYIMVWGTLWLIQFTCLTCWAGVRTS